MYQWHLGSYFISLLLVNLLASLKQARISSFLHKKQRLQRNYENSQYTLMLQETVSPVRGCLKPWSLNSFPPKSFLSYFDTSGSFIFNFLNLSAELRKYNECWHIICRTKIRTWAISTGGACCISGGTSKLSPLSEQFCTPVTTPPRC